MNPAPAPTYAFPLRALNRWAAQHLRISVNEKDEVEAVFRLEGSTCGNIPMVMLYLIRVGPAAEGWPIRRLQVSPAPHDDGYRHQCAYRADETEFSQNLLLEQPCLGRTLADAMAWSPTTSPAGCLCTEQSRSHKWRIVFHTLHYALQTKAPTKP